LLLLDDKQVSLDAPDLHNSMFDRCRLFKVLYHMWIEKSKFLLAQDSFPTIQSCISQLQNLQNVIADHQTAIRADGISEEDIENHEAVICSLIKMALDAPAWIATLQSLSEQCGK
jgi:hypothetical protein